MIHYFQNFKYSAFRLELLQNYSITSEQTSYYYFTQHQKINSIYHQDRYDIITTARQRWAIMERVHIIEKPFSPYLLYEIEAYKHNIQHGEKIFLLDNSDYNKSIDHDFRLFDDEIVIKMYYNKQWEFVWYDEITDPDNIQKYIQCKNNLLWNKKLTIL